jgi:hypothetical protein
MALSRAVFQPVVPGIPNGDPFSPLPPYASIWPLSSQPTPHCIVHFTYEDGRGMLLQKPHINLQDYKVSQSRRSLYGLSPPLKLRNISIYKIPFRKIRVTFKIQSLLSRTKVTLSKMFAHEVSGL